MKNRNKFRLLCCVKDKNIFDRVNNVLNDENLTGNLNTFYLSTCSKNITKSLMNKFIIFDEAFLNELCSNEMKEQIFEFIKKNNINIFIVLENDPYMYKDLKNILYKNIIDKSELDFSNLISMIKDALSIDILTKNIVQKFNEIDAPISIRI